MAGYEAAGQLEIAQDRLPGALDQRRIVETGVVEEIGISPIEALDRMIAERLQRIDALRGLVAASEKAECCMDERCLVPRQAVRAELVAVEHAEEGDGFIVVEQPAGHLVGDQAAERPAEQMVGTMGLPGADALQIALCRGFDAFGRPAGSSRPSDCRA